MSALKRFYSRVASVEEQMARTIPRDAAPAEVYGLIWEFLDLGGKRFRPLLAISAARACGGNDEDVLPAAAAIELFHNFTLIHDDIEDDSQLRRGKRCLHIAHGVPLALNAGDGLFMMVWRAALAIRSPKSSAIQTTLLRSFTAVLEGQAKELGWHRGHAWDLSVDDYLDMVGGKTAALVEASCEVGALCADAKPAQVKALAAYGRSIGIAFQIQDDVLNLTGTEEKYKKEIGGDIHEGKRTLMVMHALSHLSPADSARLRSILDSQTAQEADIEWSIAKMRAAGSIDYASSYANDLVSDSLKQLAKLPKTEAREELEAVARHIIEREN